MKHNRGGYLQSGLAKHHATRKPKKCPCPLTLAQMVCEQEIFFWGFLELQALDIKSKNMIELSIETLYIHYIIQQMNTLQFTSYRKMMFKKGIVIQKDTKT